MDTAQPLVINLAAGPGAGKSTTAAELFARMKLDGKRVELVTEYAKDLTYEKAFDKLSDQLYVLAKQRHRMNRLRGQVDYIITDSPLFLSCIYGPRWSTVAMDVFLDFINVVFFIERIKPYAPYGRSQTEDEAQNLDRQIREFLDDWHDYTPIRGDEHAALDIYNHLKDHRLV